MTIGARLKAERNRLEMSQSRLAEIGGITKNTQIHYEQGTCAPDANYLFKVAKSSVDVLYVITGECSAQIPGLVRLNQPQQTLIANYDAATAEDKKIIEGVARLAAQKFTHHR